MIRTAFKNILGLTPKLGDTVSCSFEGYTIRGVIIQEATEHIRLVKIEGRSTLYSDWDTKVVEFDSAFMPVDKCIFIDLQPSMFTTAYNLIRCYFGHHVWIEDKAHTIDPITCNAIKVRLCKHCFKKEIQPFQYD